MVLQAFPNRNATGSESGRDFERGVLVLKIKPILLMNYKAIYEIQQVFKN